MSDETFDGLREMTSELRRGFEFQQAPVWPNETAYRVAVATQYLLEAYDRLLVERDKANALLMRQSIQKASMRLLIGALMQWHEGHIDDDMLYAAIRQYQEREDIPLNVPGIKDDSIQEAIRQATPSVAEQEQLKKAEARIKELEDARSLERASDPASVLADAVLKLIPEGSWPDMGIIYSDRPGDEAVIEWFKSVIYEKDHQTAIIEAAEKWLVALISRGSLGAYGRPEEHVLINAILTYWLERTTRPQ